MFSFPKSRRKLGTALAAIASLSATMVGCWPDSNGAVLATPTCTSPDAPICTGNRHCEDLQGTPGCACNPGFFGDKCAPVCAAGQQDNDGNGRCTPGCKTATGESACGIHALCTDSSGTLACSCPVGYTGAPPNTPCAWTGVVNDPRFMGVPAGAWTIINATLEAGATADIDPGRVVVSNSVAAVTPAVISQQITLPALASSEPLAMRLALRTQGAGGLPANVLLRASGRTLGQRAYAGSAFHDETLCLGARWYGRPLDFSLTSVGKRIVSPNPFRPSILFAPDVYFDHLSVDPNATCPLPGTITNPNFEDKGGWVPSAADAYGSVTEIAPISGLTGLSGRLASSSGCATASLTTQASPLEGASQGALTFSFRGTQNDHAEIRFGSATLARLSGTPVAQKGSVCLPEDAKGLTDTLSVQLTATSALGACTAMTREWGFDDFAFSTDARCTSPHRISDPGFEDSAGGITTWIAFPVANAVTTAPGHASGKAGLITVAHICDSASLSSFVSVPESTVAGGVAAKFWAKSDQGSAAGVALGINLAASATTLTLTNTWTAQTICILPAYTGGSATLEFMLYGANDSPSVNGPHCGDPGLVTAQIDDVEFANDPACPAK